MSGRIAAVAALAGLALAGAGLAADTGQPAPPMATELKPLSDFQSIANRKQRSLALFAEVGKVIQHPRCLNCHPVGERPTQTDAMQPHMPLVVRGDGGIGAAGLRCTTCHHDRNFDPAGVPGNPKWHLAPEEMAWAGKSLGAICEQIKDRKRNGGLAMPELIRHMAEDELVGWGWHPGGKRTPAPGTQAQFGALFKAWAESGAHCPPA
ncbi:Isoquinoline 1-oxidoreductase subunit [Rhizorhabdus dicambivorans]|uniref:Isoquinoline 1-oxidoreductase subunit n=1 Tax=Rhizorhabdus dicambivorans TaxID=1850238 RepID=A0A2A4G0E0_9SPHN|nr:Isoquinoline 1-oxidoreductase subunit [Rhizorhabdus dicambivorans]ATE66589.1 Isoquinoline 1-oxidoreductase subunit [Rhizorhabdus dicambivorans]PCE43928.1 Isoquinoline 1-oxidoreductase subunit [Rhizorhabdus dicambivorans]